MGFDIYGQSDNYFYNNCWFWRPIQMLILSTCQNFLTTEQQQSLGFNDGYLYDEATTKKIIKTLKDILKKENKEQYKTFKKDIRKNLGKLYKDYWSKENIKDFIKFMEESKGFTIY